MLLTQRRIRDFVRSHISFSPASRAVRVLRHISCSLGPQTPKYYHFLAFLPWLQITGKLNSHHLPPLRVSHLLSLMSTLSLNFLPWGISEPHCLKSSYYYKELEGAGVSTVCAPPSKHSKCGYDEWRGP